MSELVLVSLLLGLATTSSSMIGVANGLYVHLAKTLLARILAFAAGALISALAIQEPLFLACVRMSGIERESRSPLVAVCASLNDSNWALPQMRQSTLSRPSDVRNLEPVELHGGTIEAFSASTGMGSECTCACRLPRRRR